MCCALSLQKRDDPRIQALVGQGAGGQGGACIEPVQTLLQCLELQPAQDLRVNVPFLAFFLFSSFALARPLPPCPLTCVAHGFLQAKSYKRLQDLAHLQAQTDDSVFQTRKGEKWRMFLVCRRRDRRRISDGLVFFLFFSLANSCASLPSRALHCAACCRLGNPWPFRLLLPPPWRAALVGGLFLADLAAPSFISPAATSSFSCVLVRPGVVVGLSSALVPSPDQSGACSTHPCILCPSSAPDLSSFCIFWLLIGCADLTRQRGKLLERSQSG